MPVEEDNIVKLTEEDLFKIDFIRSAIEEVVSKNRIVSGMLDQGYATAIWTQERDGKLTPDALEYALGLLSDELKDVVLEKIANPSPCN